ncbi:MAG: CBS domain-containing protein [bacterium]|jgi:CBS domain-containing protein|nr:CBS domain-containing protein [bacterium]
MEQQSILKEKIAVLEPKLSIRVLPDTPIKTAMELMIKHKIGAVLVVDENQLIGIFTERDVVTKIANQFTDLANQPISDFMTPNPMALHVNHTIAFALNRMADGGYRHIPIIDDLNHPTGIISVRDIIRYIDSRWLDGPAY